MARVKLAVLFAVAGVAIAFAAVALFGLYGIPLTVVVVALGFHLFARWYHRHYYGDRTTG